MLKLNVLLIFLYYLLLSEAKEEETACVINGKKGLNTVSDKFLSFSIDPAVLIKGLNISWSSLQLAQHLSPAFIRIGGPSTKYVLYSDKDDLTLSSEETSKLTVTSFMWKSMNDWLKSSNLTPVFALNDNDKTEGVWNPKSSLPLLEASDKMNITCYWQLGCDCTNKSMETYRNDLKTFTHILDAFPSSKQFWKTVGSDLQPCLSQDNPENIRKLVENLGHADAVIWESKTDRESNFSDSKKVVSQFAKAQLPIWIVVPKVTQPVSFSSGLEWAKQIGEAAKSGFEVIFRQPRLHEIFADTAVYWVSLLHKTFMGRNVLEVKTANSHNFNIAMYAHCTKGQNQYSRRGAITILIINYSQKEEATSIRISGSNIKSFEIQSYILNSTRENATDTYINGQLLNIKKLDDIKSILVPKLRRTRASKYIPLVLPAKSVGFYVLPGARVPVCINREDETDMLMEELEQDQNTRFSGEKSNEITTPAIHMKKSGLVELYEMMEQELENDENYYQNISGNVTAKKWKDMLLERAKKQKGEKNRKKKRIEEVPVKNVKSNNKKEDKKVKELLMSEPKSIVPPNMKMEKNAEIELTSSEERKVLNDRKKRAEIENSSMHEEENLTKQKRYAEVLLRKAQKIKAKTKLKHHKRQKRDINMDLLRRKTGYGKKAEKKTQSTFQNNQEKQASIRGPEQTSDEFISNEEPRDHTRIPEEIFAEIARNGADYTVPAHHQKETKKKTDKNEKNTRYKQPKEEIEYENQLEDSLESVDEDLKHYHIFYENFGDRKPIVPPKDTQSKELWEMDQLERRMNEDAPDMEELDELFSSKSMPKDNEKLEDNLDFMKNMEHLESLLKQAKKSQIQDDSDFDDDYEEFDTGIFKKRKVKREVSQSEVTKDDIKKYRHFLREQLKFMKKVRKNIKQQEEAELNDIKKEALVNGNKTSIRDNKKLKSHIKRLIKKLENKQRENLNSTESNRTKRDTLNEIYTSKIPAKKYWKPENIIGIKSKPSYSRELIGEDHQFLPILKEKRVAKDHDSIETNSVDEFVPIDQNNNSSISKLMVDQYLYDTNSKHKEEVNNVTAPPIENVTDFPVTTPKIMDFQTQSTEFSNCSTTLKPDNDRTTRNLNNYEETTSLEFLNDSNSCITFEDLPNFEEEEVVINQPSFIDRLLAYVGQIFSKFSVNFSQMIGLR